MMKNCVPEHILKGHHDDYIWPFKWVPRRWTSYCWEQPPRMLAGNQPMKDYLIPEGNNKARITFGPAPIPPPGRWHIAWPLYFAITTKGGWSFRIGARWDDVDFYYTFPSFRIWRSVGDTR